MWKDFAIGNWKTTLAGVLGATITIILAWLKGEMDTRTFILAFIMALVGYLAKDADKTGTVSQPRAKGAP